MFGLSPELTALFILCILLACVFEFINGFHDTANAVATVIYTNSLKPTTAVVWSGIWNALGLILGGVVVAWSIVNLLPIELLTDSHISVNISMVLALLLSAIFWNLGTWYFGIPCSSSHTLIGSILGVGIAFSLMPDQVFGTGVNWKKATDIGLSLLISPFIGFTLTILLMFFLRMLVKDKAFFKEADVTKRPPMWTRAVLVSTCTLVSFNHGNNDGQKGVGLLLLILIGFAPGYFALNTNLDLASMRTGLAEIKTLVVQIENPGGTTELAGDLNKITAEIATLESILPADNEMAHVATNVRFSVRKNLLVISKAGQSILNSRQLPLSEENKEKMTTSISQLKKYTEYAPNWAILLVSLSLGLGTMIGWRRIVTTIGEKIGKQHLSYAQGASAELVAALTISLASSLKLPVSTTHVLSSGIAGSMVASKGVKNLRKSTITNMLLAWVLTLPVTILLSSGLFFLFNWIFGKIL